MNNLRYTIREYVKEEIEVAHAENLNHAISFGEILRVSRFFSRRLFFFCYLRRNR